MRILSFFDSKKNFERMTKKLSLMYDNFYHDEFVCTSGIVTWYIDSVLDTFSKCNVGPFARDYTHLMFIKKFSFLCFGFYTYICL